MDNNEQKQKYKRNMTNKPIYKYKPISYYTNKPDEQSSEDEEEFSYRFNDKKLKLLEEKKTKKEKIKKYLEDNNENYSKSELNLFENQIKKNLNFDHKEIPVEKNIKKKKIKRSSKTKSNKKDESKEISNSFYEYIPNEGEMKKTISLNDLNKENGNENNDKVINNCALKSEKKLSNLSNLLNEPEFYGFEVDEKDYKKETNNNDFLFDEMNNDKKKVKLKKKKNSKSLKKNKTNNDIIIDNKNNSDIKDNNKTTNVNNNDKIEKLNNDDKVDKIIDIKDNEIKNENIDDNNKENNLLKEDKLNNKKKHKIIKKKKIIKKSSNKKIKENFAVKIQNLWKIYQLRKKIKLMLIKKKLIIKLSDFIKNKINKDYYSYFFIHLKNIDKKNKNSLKLDEKIENYKVDNEKLKELIEKENKYDILIIKYEEALKEIKKLKNELENRKTFFNQNLNLIDNKNQNISINIFPTESTKKIIDKKHIKNKINQVEKINELTIKNPNNKFKNNFIINKKVNIELLNKRKNENILNLNKIVVLSKIFHRMNNNYNLYLKNYFEKFKMKSIISKYIQEMKKSQNIKKEKNIIINKVKAFSLIKIKNERLYNNKNQDNFINKNNFNESKLIITKNISKLQILQNNKNINIKKNNLFNNLIINKQINKSIINKKPKCEFIIVKLKNYNIIENKNLNKRNIFSNLSLIREKDLNIKCNMKIQKPLIICRKYELNIKKFEKKVNNYIIHKTINNKIISNNNMLNFENKIIKYLSDNLNIISKIKKEFHLDKKYFTEKDLFINKVSNLNIYKIKKKENIVYKSKNNDFIISGKILKQKKEYIITKVQDNFSIRNKKKNNNFIINKAISNFTILESEVSEETIDEYISISETYQLTINGAKKTKMINKKHKNYVINRVINKSVIDKIYKKFNIDKFNDKKLKINKINNYYILQKIIHPENIIYKSSNNNFSLYRDINKNKLNNHIITKIQNIFYAKNSYKNNNNMKNNNNCVINKVITRLYFPKIKRNENIITRTITDNIKLIKNNEKEENQISQTKKFDKNLIITKVISKLNINNVKKEKNIKFKSKFLFVSDNNQLFIKRKKNSRVENISPINNYSINNILNDSIKENEINNSCEINNGETKKKKKKLKKFKSKKLFISDNNQLKIKAIKNKKEK